MKAMMVCCVAFLDEISPNGGTGIPGSLGMVTQGLGMGCMSYVTNVSSGDVALPNSVPSLESIEHNRLGIGASVGEV